VFSLPGVDNGQLRLKSPDMLVENRRRWSCGDIAKWCWNVVRIRSSSLRAMWSTPCSVSSSRRAGRTPAGTLRLLWPECGRLCLVASSEVSQTHAGVFGEQIDIQPFVAEIFRDPDMKVLETRRRQSLGLRRKDEASTGMSVSVSTSDATSANMTVSAIGRNILPSTPCRLRIGR
jgi:hypothetical protein